MNNEFCFDQNYNQDFELARYKKQIDLDYSKISYKFGTTSRLSPDKLENYNQYHLYNKLFKNEKQRKSIQVKAQTINPITVKHFLNNKGRFINYTKNKVYDIIKGKHYIMQLGQIPLSTRSKTPTQKTQSCQYTQTSFYQGQRTQRIRSTTPSQQRQKTCDDIYKACQVQLKEQMELKETFKTMRVWSANQYDNKLKRPQSCFQHRNQEQRNNQFMNQFTENIFKLSSSFKD